MSPYRTGPEPPPPVVIGERANPLLVLFFVLAAFVSADGAWSALAAHSRTPWRPSIVPILCSVPFALCIWLRVRVALVIDRAHRSLRIERRRLRTRIEVLPSLDRVTSARLRTWTEANGTSGTNVVLRLKDGTEQAIDGFVTARGAKRAADAVNGALSATDPRDR